MIAAWTKSGGECTFLSRIGHDYYQLLKATDRSFTKFFELCKGIDIKKQTRRATIKNVHATANRDELRKNMVERLFTLISMRYYSCLLALTKLIMLDDASPSYPALEKLPRGNMGKIMKIWKLHWLVPGDWPEKDDDTAIAAHLCSTTIDNLRCVHQALVAKTLTVVSG